MGARATPTPVCSPEVEALVARFIGWLFALTLLACLGLLPRDDTSCVVASARVANYGSL